MQKRAKVGTQSRLNGTCANRHQTTTVELRALQNSFSQAVWAAIDAAEGAQNGNADRAKRPKTLLFAKLWPPFSEILPHMRRARLETAARNGILRLNGTCVIFVIKRESHKPNLPAPVARLDFANKMKYFAHFEGKNGQISTAQSGRRSKKFGLRDSLSRSITDYVRNRMKKNSPARIRKQGAHCRSRAVDIESMGKGSARNQR